MEGRDGRPVRIASVAAHTEREVLRVPGGLQDHYAAAFGGINFIEFKEETPCQLPADPFARSTGAGVAAVALLHGPEPVLRDSHDDQQQRVEAGSETSLQSLREMREMAYTMKSLLLRNQIDELGSLLNAGWQAKRKLSPQISSDFVDGLHRTLFENGAFGAKLCGAGGGGYMLALVPLEKKMRVVEALQTTGVVSVTEVTLADQGVEVW